VCFALVFFKKKFIIAPKYQDVKNRILSINGDALFTFSMRVKADEFDFLQDRQN